MPLDSNLMLAATRGPQVDTPQEAYGKALTLGAAFQSQRMNQLELKKAQRAEDDDKATRDAYAQNTTIGADGAPVVDQAKTMGQLLQTGHPQAAMAIGASIRAQKMAETEAQLKQLDLTSKRAGRIGEIAQSVTDDETYQRAIQQMATEGLMPAQQIAQMKQEAPNWSPALVPHIQQLVAQSMSAKDFAEAKQKKLLNDSTITKNEAEGIDFRSRAKKTEQDTAEAWRTHVANVMGSATNQADYDQRRQQLAGEGAPPAALAAAPLQFSQEAAQQLTRSAMPALGREQADQTKVRDAQTAKNEDQSRAQEGKRIAIQGAELGLRQKQFNVTFGSGNDANGHPLPLDERKAVAIQDPTAVAIANYQLAPPGGRTSGIGKALMDKVMAIDKDYDASQFPARAKTRQDFSASGASGKALTSADTALSHLAMIQKAGEALKSGDLRLLNGLANQLGLQSGSSAPAVYDTVVSMVAPEISKAVIGAAGGEGERVAMGSNFSSKASPEQRQGSIAAAAQLLRARMEKSAHSYEQTMGKPLPWQPSPESQQVLQQFSAKPATLPEGGGKAIDKSTAAQFYKAAGGDPARARDLAKEKGWKVQ